ncbi:ArsR/SmtB family transcription factor [Sulfurimonas autotrophica]|uniref:Transcriptional regulator, ArsR family n=1 Tax=Sulfurimonas autotrophica (strain ATCC BAA-671 / DSM 16294 / JCM 11897 / OK10) TaxID=563040 RepID=E0UP45_SULAO|nr:metalloregulator ArsR/SmtB family transcription factor [Sulfurimonas autotrophica]ADN08078.1 transcriptional regulator, ArsR family [Sulfurimonas autotrophica DSM 16294]
MEKLVTLAKILSDSNRLRIVALMHREKELCVCEICDTLELSQPLVSRHLKQMREASLVQTKQSGKWIIYSLHENKTLECLLETIKKDIQKLPKIIACAAQEKE